LTAELDLDKVKMNRHTQISRSKVVFVQKLLSGNIDRHTPEPPLKTHGVARFLGSCWASSTHLTLVASN